MGIWKSTKEYFKKQREIYRSVSEQDVIIMALENENKITAASLSTHTPLSHMQASRKLQAMSTKGILQMKYDYSTNYASYYKVKHPDLFKNLSNTTSNFSITSKKEAKALSDAEVISAAVKAKGRLIPGVLCINADITIDQAKAKLQELQYKGVFDIEVTAEGAMVYLLNDYKTYRDLMGEETSALDE